MPRQATSTGGEPFAKLNQLGDRLVGAWAGATRRQQRDFETRALKTKRDDPSKPLMEEVNWFVVMDDTRAGELNPGDACRFSFDGFKWKQVIDARKELPAMPEFKIAAGKEASTDVYTIELVGWSAETKNAEGARAAGFTVVDGRIVLRSQDDKDRYVLHQSRNGGNTNPAKDLAIAIRRINLPAEQKWADLADELYDAEPWNRAAAAAVDDAPHPAEQPAFDPSEEPF